MVPPHRNKARVRDTLEKAFVNPVPANFARRCRTRRPLQSLRIVRQCGRLGFLVKVISVGETQVGRSLGAKNGFRLRGWRSSGCYEILRSPWRGYPWAKVGVTKRTIMLPN